MIRLLRCAWGYTIPGWLNTRVYHCAHADRGCRYVALSRREWRWHEADCVFGGAR